MASLGLAQDREQYRIESQLWLDGEMQDVPPAIITVDEPAFLFRANEEGRAEEGGWRLELRANPVDDPLGVSQSLWVDVQLSLFRAGLWEPVLDAMLGVPEGEFSTLSVAPEGETPTPETAEVYLRLSTLRMAPSDDQASTDGP